MEKAIFITKVSQLKDVDGRYTRLYYGNEFCERLIPSIVDLKKVIRCIQKKDFTFSLVTPYVNNEGIEKIEGLLDLLKRTGMDYEVIVNDWGVLNLINSKYNNGHPVLGRLLTKQKRGPRLIELLKRKGKYRLLRDSQNPNQRQILIQKKLPIELDYYYKGSNTSSVPIIQQFLVNKGIKRIELDNIQQGLYLDIHEDNLSVSIYTPYVYISTTMFCPTARCDVKEKSFLKIKPCRKECQRYTFKLRHPIMPKVVYLKGNTKFYKNTKLSIRRLEKLGVNRLVYQHI